MNEKKKCICFITGKRGGFGAMTPTLQKITNDPRLELKIIVTDMHLSEKFGKTKKEVKSHFKIDKEVKILETDDDSPIERSKVIGKCVIKMVDALNEIKPDILLVLGDRGEIMASVIAGANLGIPIAHVHGGEISGSLDEIYRHVISKFAHIHLTPTEITAQRIRNLGEEESRIHIVGYPQSDLISEKIFMNEEDVRKEFNINKGEKLIVVLQHPESTTPNESHEQMKETMDAVEELKQKTIVIYPCSDQGYNGIIKAIKEKEKLSFVQSYKNLEFSKFLGLLSIADVFLGNSSSGVIEAPYFGLPTVNIGIRQQGRDTFGNTINADYSKEDILLKVKQALYDDEFKTKIKSIKKKITGKSPSELIVKTLKEVKIDDALLNKKFIVRYR